MKNIYKTLLVSAAASASLLSVSTSSYACSSQPYLGSICAFGGNFPIRGFATASGQLLSISQYSALFSLYGTTYGGDGRTTFGLPDLRGRAPIGVGNGPGLDSINLGQKGGAVSTTLNITNMPNHAHNINATVSNNMDFSGSSATLKAFSGTASTNSPTGNVLADSPRRENIYSSGVPNVDMGAEAISLSIETSGDIEVTGDTNAVGGNLPFNNRSPYLAVTYLIALQGVFPPRS